MKKYYPVLKNCLLFSGIEESDFKSMLDCLAARQKHFKKNSFIFISGETGDFMGIVLQGAIHVLRDDFWGRRKILARIESGGLFGEAFACAGLKKLPVSIMAAEESEVLLLSSRRITSSCPEACVFHIKLIKNLTVLLAEKNVTLIQKLQHITQTTTREKLLSYLSGEAQNAGNSKFIIPFNREELASYLAVERSAMSAELSRMKNDGLINYRKNSFELINVDKSKQKNTIGKILENF